MDSIVDNQQKYENYRIQMGRLKAALRGHFYLEAIFIEYAIMEDRLEAILRHTDKWHPKEGWKDYTRVLSQYCPMMS